MIPLINGIAEAWFRHMTSSTLQATILALLILGILWIGRRWPPALRYALMMLALCKFAIPPMLSLPTGLFNRVMPPQQSESAPVQNLLRPVEISPVDAFKSSMAYTPSGGTYSAERFSPAITVKGILLMLHCSGALLILGWTAARKNRLRKLVLRSAPVQDPVLAEAYDEISRSVKLSRRPRLLISEDNNAPIAFGVWRPVIILPQSLIATLPLSGIRTVLVHELAHHRRRDPGAAWSQTIISAIWWFNPVYWLLSRSLRSVREDCCDDMALASGFASREVYCRTLLQAARASLNNAMTQAAFAYLGESLPLRRRFKRILSAKHIRAPKLAMTGMLAVFALALVLLPGIEPRILAQNAAPADSAVVKPVSAPHHSNKAANPEVQAPDPNTADELRKNKELSMMQAPGRDQLEEAQAQGDLSVAQYYLERRNLVGAFTRLRTYLEKGNFVGVEARLKFIKDNYPNSSRMNEVDVLIQQAQQIQALAASNPYWKWLFEDVVYLIAPEERNEFLAIKTNQERESFIERFWARRDSSFKAEHYRRIAYANEHFASSAPGWKTDRGRIYIKFGKPDERETHPAGGKDAGVAGAYPFETWRYWHIAGVGDDVEIEFVDVSGTGEYRVAMSPDEY
jgi:GWxTD domain-containing protein